MTRRGAILLTVLAGVVSGFVAGAGTTASAEPAEIVFESGTRVISIDADGGERKNLTPWKELEAWGIGALPATPSISPDGQRIAFVETFYVRGWPYTRVYVADRDGSNRRVIRNSRRFPLKSSIWDLVWDKAGRVVTVEYLQGGTARGFNLTRVVSMSPTGANRKVEVKRTYHGVRDHFIIWAEVSPDNDRILISTVKGTGGANKLEVLDRSTGQGKVIRRDAGNGSWSPDGRRIAFESDQTGIRERCFRGECYGGDTKIFVMRSDGKGPARRLTRGNSPGNETSASWSPDGSKIAFASDRNSPMMAEGNGREIYTINPDGSCLTWLTNGSPASSSPTWGPETDRDYSPEECGTGNRPALVELVPEARPLVNGELIEWPRLWFGPVFNDRAQSYDDTEGRELGYADCVRFRTGDCAGPEWTISSDDVCLDWAGQIADFGGVGRIIEHRGALVLLPDFKRRDYEALVLTGGQALMLTPDRRRGRPQASASAYLQAIDALRPVGEADAEADLEPPVISRKNVVTARRIAAKVKQTGSIRKAGKESGHRPHEVRDWLNLNKAIKEFGPVRTVSCKGWFRESYSMKPVNGETGGTR